MRHSRRFAWSPRCSKDFLTVWNWKVIVRRRYPSLIVEYRRRQLKGEESLNEYLFTDPTPKVSAMFDYILFYLIETYLIPKGWDEVKKVSSLSLRIYGKTSILRYSSSIISSSRKAIRWPSKAGWIHIPSLTSGDDKFSTNESWSALWDMPIR